MNDDPPIRLIIGLGNPGRKYEGTRHNVGFEILDLLAAAAGAPWKPERKWKSETARIGDITLVKPQTFMNLSGESVAGLSRFLKVAPESILVIYDDVDLPLGRLRLRRSGSAGGHNGIKSIIQHLGSDRFPRLKFGIGRDASGHRPMASHVLGRFEPDEAPAMKKGLACAQDAVNYALASGLAAAMNRFNTDPEKARQSKPRTKPDSATPAGSEPAPSRDNSGEKQPSQS